VAAGRARRGSPQVGAPQGGTNKRYDRAYFDRWYRDPASRVADARSVARKASLALSAAEYLLEGSVRSVLDVGCGEGSSGVALRRMRPDLRYTGVDGSAYVVQRFGRSRHIVRGTVGTLGDLSLGGPFDLVVCCDVLHYVPADELARGLPALAALVGDGVAYIDFFTSADDVEGDLRGFLRRPPSFYARALGRAGLEACGLNVYVASRG
jgi:SAM-dependent methyltransferase